MVVSRIHGDGEDRSVPAWRALNEATSIVDPAVTRAGLLPILQATADGNDTNTTMINCFVDFVKPNSTGQKHTIWWDTGEYDTLLQRML